MLYFEWIIVNALGLIFADITISSPIFWVIQAIFILIGEIKSLIKEIKGETNIKDGC